MGAIRGVSKLPIYVEKNDALEILELLSEANLMLGQIKTKIDCSIVSNQLVQVLSLNESIQSSTIEGTQVTFSDLIEEKKLKKRRWEIREVLNYQTALKKGVERLSNGNKISSQLLKDLHAILMEGARGSTASMGEFRNVQNFIGPTRKIEDAVYLPVAANEIDEYMDNLIQFINNDSINTEINPLDQQKITFGGGSPALIKAAITHAQFESIHPFLDGNGRMGRILIALNIINEGLIEQPIFLVSEELEKERARYYDLLNGVRGNNPDWGSWIAFFITACKRMAESLLIKLNKVDSLATEGIQKCKTSIEQDVWLFTFREPIVTASEIADYIKISQTTARSALRNLDEKGLIYGDKSAKRNVKYRNYDLLRVLKE